MRTRDIALLDTDPQAVAGLQLWLDASQISGLVDGNAVTTWADRSGNGYDATQAVVANQPTYKVNILGNRPVVRFANSHWLSLTGTGLGLLRNVTGATAIMVLQTTLPGATRWALMISTAVPGTSRVTLGREVAVAANADLRCRRLDADAVAEVHGAGLVAGAWSVTTAVVDYASTLARLYQSNTLLASSDAFLTAGSSSDTDSGSITIGAGDSGSAPISGDIAEVLVYDHALTDGQRCELQRHLGRKWGIALS